MIVVLETSNARPQRIAVFLYGHGSASTISQRTYFCHVPGHICLLSPPPEECLPVGECLFVIPRTMPHSCLHILGADFPSLVNYVLAQKRLRRGVINRESCFLRTGGPPTHRLPSLSEWYALFGFHSQSVKGAKMSFQRKKNIIKDVCNIASLPLPSKRNKWIFCSVLLSPGSWATDLGKTGRRH